MAASDEEMSGEGLGEKVVDEEEEEEEEGENEAIFSCVGRTEVYKRPHCMHWSLLPKSVIFISIKKFH